jgi:hypothetical protein
MAPSAWWGVGISSMAVLIGLVIAWLRMPLYHWSCRGCNKSVSSSRFHPPPCDCGGNTLIACFCKRCGSWNTSPASHNRRCGACASNDLLLGIEYHFRTNLWRIRNRNSVRTY